eukprot:TRINITY_DN3966_c0_g1_i3.p1 TRINITY_DN3966_c0_g1~~TRINITY_DN3966_c0_g1_i3.p1  ORF type:complete len:491 (+),score=65.94 TRINITY_DN3966_c0_g1_i3:592-2064(+)
MAPLLRHLLESGANNIHPRCPNDCTHRGVCSVGCVCICDPPYYGDHCQFHEQAEGANQSTPKPITIKIEGPIYSDGSFAHINRKLLQVLTTPEFQELARFTISPTDRESKQNTAYRPSKELASHINARLPNRVELYLRHSWPPIFSDPPLGRVVVFIPWEYCSFPVEWIEAIAVKVDHVLVPSAYVKGCLVDSGVDADLISVIPLGIDPKYIFPPQAENIQREDIPIPIEGLKTRKRTHFLFVGGTIHRKGIDILLETYLDTFNSNDDVTLLIKDVGTKTSYKGQTYTDIITQEQLRPRTRTKIQGQDDQKEDSGNDQDTAAAEILYTQSDLNEAQMGSLYRWAHALVHPYRGEGFGLPILEAMGCATPVIVPSAGSAMDFVSATRGLFVNCTRHQHAEASVGPFATVAAPSWVVVDRADLARAMREVATRQIDLEAMGRDAALYAHSNATWTHTARLLLRSLSRVRALGIRRLQPQMLVRRFCPVRGSA